ncbi:MAG: SAM-dependent methyltransferase [Zetaproteobacteria bacterium]|nr:SAM-dependent methyltransferase [Zetaproteobacteria bacterium]
MTTTSQPASCLYLLATHIGNPEDFPPRSLRLLQEAELTIFEEDRPARRALKAAGITRPYLKLSEHREHETLTAAKQVWKSGGRVTYMSDQGTPGLADPGAELVQCAYEHQVQVRVIPGPSSVSAAIAACPFHMQSYTFAGFLARKSHLRQQELHKLRGLHKPIIILDTPYRLTHLLADTLEVFGKHQRALLALDISGSNERYLCTSLGKLSQQVTQEQISSQKLNFVLILAGKS